nr:NADH-quinone oxidoreductase subunit C [candidate division Zixibacteria bacterium]
MNREELIQYLQDKFQDKIELLDTGKVEPMFLIKSRENLVSFCRAIVDDPQLSMDFLCNLAGIDTGEHFEVVYNVASIRNKTRFDFKVVMDYDGAWVESIKEIWPAANWYEREVWELFGIDVKNHGNLKRFLLPDDWDQGHPMRKNWDAPDFKRMPEF